MKFYLTVFFVLSVFLFPDKNVQRKIISDSEFNYIFYVTTKESVSVKGAKYYHWYKSGEIHSSLGGSTGNLLHGDYTKSYKDNNLAEQGSFKKGLKNGRWKKWYRNGQLHEIANWNNGLRTGRYLQFSETGELLIGGNFKNNRKNGIWVNGAIKDTMFFKKGVEIEKPKRYTRKPFIKRATGFFEELFRKKEKDSILKEQKVNDAVPKSKKREKKKKSKNQKIRGRQNNSSSLKW